MIPALAQHNGPLRTRSNPTDRGTLFVGDHTFSQVIRGIRTRPEPSGNVPKSGQTRQGVAGSNPVSPTDSVVKVLVVGGFRNQEGGGDLSGPWNCPGIGVGGGRPWPGGLGAHLVRMSDVMKTGPVVERLWSMDELVEYLGVSKSTVYDWRGRGLGPVAHRLGKHLRFARADVDAWLAGRRDGGDRR